MTYRLTNEASVDLINVYVEGVRRFGVVQAENYFDRLVRAFLTIVDNPRIARERAETFPPVRVFPCGTHVIVYRQEDDNEVLIIRVRHAREDWAPNPA